MRIPIRKIVRISGILLGGVVFTLCLAVAGTLIWLRTDAGERFVAKTATDVLAGQGLFLTMDSIDGPLPSRILLTNINLADAKGKWFSAKELELDISLAALSTLTAKINLLRVNTPEIFRLPELPSATEPETQPDPKEPKGVPAFSLPVAVALESLLIEQCGVFAPLLFPKESQGDGPLLRVTINGKAHAQAAQPLEAVISLAASVADMQSLAAHLQADTVPLTEFAFNVNAKASIGPIIEAKLTGTVTPEISGESLPINYNVHAQLAGTKAALPSATIHGLGIRLDARGGANLETNAFQTEAEFKTENGGKWEALVSALAGQDLGGAVTASLKASLDADKTVTAAINASGADMRWGVEQLQHILGPRFTVKAHAGGSEATQYTLNLATLQAGTVDVSGEAAFGPGDESLSATLEATLSDVAAAAPGVKGSLRATLAASGTLAAPSAKVEITSNALETEAASIEKLHAIAALSGTLDAPIASFDASVHAVTTEAATLKDLTAKANVSGTITAPKFSLEATSKTISTQAGEFKQFRAGIDGTGALPENGDKTVNTTADVSLGASPAGPVALRTSLDATQAPNGTLSAHLHGLDLALAGTSLAADITALMPATTGNTPALPALNGTASVDITDWKPIAALSGQPISGSKAGVTATFSHSANVQQITASVKADTLTLPEVFSLNKLSGNLQASDLANPDIALNLVMDKGQAGPVTWQTGAVAVNAKQGNGTFAAALRTDKTATKALATAAKNAPAQPGKTEQMTAVGSFDISSLRVTLDRFAARVPQSSLGVYLAVPTTVALGKGTKVENFKLNVVPGKGTIALDAIVDASNADVAATITEFPLRLLRDAVDASVPDGTLSAEAAIKKSGASIQGTINAKAIVTPPATDGIKSPPVEVVLASTLDQKADPNFPELRVGGGISRLKGNVNIGFAGNQTTASNSPDAKINFNVPLQSTKDGSLEPALQAPLRASVDWRGEIAPLWALAPMQDRHFSGLAQVTAHVTGNMGNPEYKANAYIANGRFEDNIQGLLLTGIALEAASSSAGDSKILLRAEDGMGGSLALEGSLVSPKDADNAISVPHLSARGHINHLQPLHRDDISLRLSGLLSVNGPLDALLVAADVEVERGELSLANIAGGVRTLEISNPDAKPTPSASSPNLDVKISIPHRFYIRGHGMDSEWGGNLALSGKASSPALTGNLRPIRGTFSIMSRTFAFSEGDIAFMGGDRINPNLNLALTHEGPNITAVIRALGTANKPKIAMESRPPLPQDQIMAEVLFGKEFSKLSRFEALQVANNIRQLANFGESGGGVDPLTSMRTSLGIDMLRVGSSGGERTDNRSVSNAPGANAFTGGSASSGGGDDAASAPTLEAGKYINDAIYVGVEQGATSDSTGVRIEVELRPNLNLQGKTTTNSSQIGLGWKKDY